MTKTTIEWTDETWSPITGCSVVSPGCTNCYAMRLAGTRLQHHPSRSGLTRETKKGPVWTGEVRLNKQWTLQPLQWKRPRRIFVVAHGDLFHEAVPDPWIDFVMMIASQAPQHTFQILTKRPERMKRYSQLLASESEHDTGMRIGIAGNHAGLERFQHPFQWPLPNVWLGTSVEDQARADERIPLLLDTPAAVRWISAEPLLGPVDLMIRRYETVSAVYLDSLDWVVAGGESGPDARPMHPDWARSVRDQCDRAGVPFLFKQWGNWRPLSDPGEGYWPKNADSCRRINADGSYGPEGIPIQRVGKTFAGRKLDGRLHDGYPQGETA